MARRRKLEVIDEDNAEVFSELIVEPSTPDNLRVSIIEKILEAREGQDFFKTMFEENLSVGECPCCNFKTHWLIPEDNLNQMGYVTYKVDSGIAKVTNINTCPTYMESCKKRKINA